MQLGDAFEVIDGRGDIWLHHGLIGSPTHLFILEQLCVVLDFNVGSKAGFGLLLLAERGRGPGLGLSHLQGVIALSVDQLLTLRVHMLLHGH